jgi:hypothetical protein
MSFRNREKERYETLKPKLFSKEAQPSGAYKQNPYPFCLADGYSQENLHKSFRNDAIDYFKKRNIPWHDGIDSDGVKNSLPSNHLCCSQTMCVNTLFPMTTDKQLLQNVFQIYFPEMKEPLPFTTDDPLPNGDYPYVCFEFVGKNTHFDGERSWPQRGANCTSLDFAFLFRRHDGKKQLVLGEWKYTEEYKSLKLPPIEEVNKTRWKTYQADFETWRADNPNVPTYEHYFVEPFYQLMRQSVLADKMQLESEMNADIVVHLHISPKANREFSDFFTSPIFSKHGNTVLEAWKGIAHQDKFISVHSESLLTAIEQMADANKRDWADWLLKRYGWWKNSITC